MDSMFEDDNRRLVQIVSIANAIARAGNAAPWRALKWLAEQAKAGALPARLYLPERNAKEACHCAASDESLKVWRALEQGAKARRLDRNLMPAAASTWFVHVNDLLQFIEAATLPDAVRAELRELAQRHCGPTAVSFTPVTLADSQTAAAATVAETPAATLGRVHSTARRRNLLSEVIERAQAASSDRFDRVAVWVELGKLAAEKAATLIGATEDGIQYLENGDMEIFTRKALVLRLKRLKEKAERAR